MATDKTARLKLAIGIFRSKDVKLAGFFWINDLRRYVQLF